MAMHSNIANEGADDRACTKGDGGRDIKVQWQYPSPIFQITGKSDG